jgi:hypothetical protein
LFVVLGALLVSCTISAPAPPAVEVASPPYLVVKAMYSALNNGDIERTMNFFSDDAIYIIRNGPEKGMYGGKEQIRRLLEPEIKNKVTSEMSDLEFSDNIIAMEHKRIQNAEAISSEIEVFAVVNGKITGVGINPESLIRFAFNALNEGEVDKAIDLFAEHPICSLISDSPLTGKQAIKNVLQKYIDSRDIFEVSNVDEVEYYKVTWTLKIYDPHGKVIIEVRRLSHIDSGKIQDCVPVH